MSDQNAAPTQPVSPHLQLSDEDRERLERMADRITAAASRRDTTPATESAEEDAELLRELASQQPRRSNHLMGKYPSIPVTYREQHGEVEEDAPRVAQLERALRDVRFHTGRGESKDGTIIEIRQTVDRVLADSDREVRDGA